MEFIESHKKLLIVTILVSIVIALYSVSTRDKFNVNDFVGKWQSSRSMTPLYLYDNGEWEIKTDTGSVLQYGIWEYKNKKIIWRFSQGSRVKHDVNPVILSTAQEFQLLESDQSITTFVKIN